MLWYENYGNKEIKMAKNKLINLFHWLYNIKWLSKIKKEPLELKSVQDSLITESFYIEKVKHNGFALESVPDSIKTKMVCLAAVNQDSLALKYVPDSKMTKSLCLTAVKKSWLALKYVPESLKTKKMCIVAIKKSWLAFKYFPTRLKISDALIYTVIRKEEDSFAFNDIPKNFKKSGKTFIIRLTDDEIDIINVWANNRMNDIDKTIWVEKKGKRFLIDTYTQSKLKNIKFTDDPYYGISRPKFNKKITEAVMYYSEGAGALSGYWYVAIFSKENNIWKQIDAQFLWMA